MNIRFFMLGSGNANYTRRIEEGIYKVFAGCIPENGVKEFDSVKEATEDIRKAFADSHVLVFLSEPSRFAETKTVLSKALGFSLECNLTMLRKASSTAGLKTDENSEFAYMHAWVPEKTRLFTAGDGLYTGFSVISGNQTIIVLPLERGRTDLLLSSQIVPYINSAYHVRLSVSELKKYYTDTLRTAFEERDITVSLAGTNTAEFFKEYLSFDSELDKRIIISRKAEKRGSQAPVDYVVNLSIAACEYDGTPYGIAISNAYYTGESSSDEKIVYVAVTNERETAVRKIHSVIGEDVSVFLTRCCSDICAFICDVLENDDDREVLVEKRIRVIKRRYILAMILTALLTAGVAFFGFTYFAAHNYSPSKWLESAKSYLFPGSSISVQGEFGTLAPGQEQSTSGSIFDIITQENTTASPEPLFSEFAETAAQGQTVAETNTIKEENAAETEILP